MELVKGNFSSLEDALRAQTLKLQNQIEKLERQVHVAKFERDEEVGLPQISATKILCDRFAEDSVQC